MEVDGGWSFGSDLASFPIFPQGAEEYSDATVLGSRVDHGECQCGGGNVYLGVAAREGGEKDPLSAGRCVVGRVCIG